jgi:hypothetical protein
MPSIISWALSRFMKISSVSIERGYSDNRMQIAAFMNIHSTPELVADTLDSIFTYMTTDVLLVVDGASSAFDHVSLPAPKMTGFRHGCSKAPYRNLALGFKAVQSLHPSADWYCYIEPDCLVASERFRRNLTLAAENEGVDAGMRRSGGFVSPDAVGRGDPS